MRRGTERHSALRTVRGWLLTVSSATLGVTAHTVADGATPNLSLTVLLTALIGWTSTSVAERTRGAGGILLVLGIGQLLMHLVLTELAVHAHPPGGGHAMTAAHALATVGTAVVLARAESLLLLVAATLRLCLPTAWRAVPVPGGPVAPALPQAGPHLLERYFARAHGRRGPPAHS